MGFLCFLQVFSAITDYIQRLFCAVEKLFHLLRKKKSKHLVVSVEMRIFAPNICYGMCACVLRHTVMCGRKLNFD
jgi:hypothetical protein